MDRKSGHFGKQTAQNAATAPANTAGTRRCAPSFGSCARHNRRRHVAHLREVKPGVWECRQSVQCKSRVSNEDSSRGFFCDDCGISMNSTRQAEDHLQGTRHKTRLKDLEEMHLALGKSFTPAPLRPCAPTVSSDDSDVERGEMDTFSKQEQDRDDVDDEVPGPSAVVNPPPIQAALALAPTPVCLAVVPAPVPAAQAAAHAGAHVGVPAAHIGVPAAQVMMAGPQFVFSSLPGQMQTTAFSSLPAQMQTTALSSLPAQMHTSAFPVQQQQLFNVTFLSELKRD
eukprot:Hpha_TRINITY_DN15415_c2_g4::TRINITY_DN15415_c2_g4_i4::g.175557::m.175557